MLSELNFLAIIAAAIGNFVIGGLWYSPALFSKIWQREVKLSDEAIKSANIPRTFGLAFLASLIIAFCLAAFIGSETTLAQGALYGFLAGIGWVAMAMGINDLFEQRSVKLYLINAGYHTLSFTAMGAILGLWH